MARKHYHIEVYKGERLIDIEGVYTTMAQAFEAASRRQIEQSVDNRRERDLYDERMAQQCLDDDTLDDAIPVLIQFNYRFEGRRCPIGARNCFTVQENAS